MCDILCPKCEGCNVKPANDEANIFYCLDCGTSTWALDFAIHGVDNSGRPEHSFLYWELLEAFEYARVGR